MSALLTYNYWPGRWRPVPKYQLDNARNALRPMPGTVMVEMQPEITTSTGGIHLVAQKGVKPSITETWAMFPPYQPTAGTVVAVGAPVTDFLTQDQLTQAYNSARKAGHDLEILSPRLEDYADLGLKVGDRVLIRYEHGNGFLGWHTPPYMLNPKGELKILGRVHLQPEPEVPFTDCLFVPMDMSITATIEGDTIRPTGRNVLLKRDDLRTKSGLIELPGRAQSRSTLATVVAAGPRCTELAAGDRVVYSPASLRYWRGAPGEEKLALVPESAILAKVEDA